MKILKFGAIWCSGCLVMKPRWAEIEKELPWINTEYYDVDEHKEIVKKYEITDFPCFIFLDKNNNEIHRLYGEITKNDLTSTIINFKDY